jgi:hypothetical protein
MGLINYNGHLEIHSSLLNVVLHDESAHQLVSNFRQKLTLGSDGRSFSCSSSAGGVFRFREGMLNGFILAY